jgi:hypothetical protein
MYLESYTCELCLLQKEEKLRHLFLSCSFAKNCWQLIGVQVATLLQPQRAVRKAAQSPLCDGTYHPNVLGYMDRKK